MQPLRPAAEIEACRLMLSAIQAQGSVWKGSICSDKRVVEPVRFDVEGVIAEMMPTKQA